MDECARTLNRLAVECSYQTLKTILDEVQALKSDGRARYQDVLRYMEESTSEVSLQHSDMEKVLRSLEAQLKEISEELRKSNGRKDRHYDYGQ